jgi:hypothetical protein
MSLASAKMAYAMQLFINSQLPGDATLAFCKAFTGYFKNASLDGTPIETGTESLPHAAGALLSGVTLAFKSEEKNMTCLFLQAAFVSYWSAKDPATDEVALKTMWPGCTPPAIVEQPLASFLIPALDEEGMEPLEAQTAIAGAIFEWLTTAVKVDVGGDYFYFV